MYTHVLPFVTSKYFQEFLCSQSSTLADRFSGLFIVVFAAHLSVDVGLKRAGQHIDVHNERKDCRTDRHFCVSRCIYCALPDMPSFSRLGTRLLHFMVTLPLAHLVYEIQCELLSEGF